MFTVQCPKCKNKMKYMPKGSLLGKKKRCVYCGFAFAVHPDIEKSRIVSS